MINDLLLYIVPILIGFLVFLIMREFMCWYWKINKISSQLEDIKELLKERLDRKGKE